MVFIHESFHHRSGEVAVIAVKVVAGIHSKDRIAPRRHIEIGGIMSDLNRKQATSHSREANRKAAAELPPENDDFELATRGQLLEYTDPIEREGWPVFDMGKFDFIGENAPDTVNPSLWRQARLNKISGLFEVCDGIYQARGLDISNITFVRGETGWIVIDTGSVSQSAAKALELITLHLGQRPVVGVIYTHSHIDHFGGVRGLLDEQRVIDGEVPVLAPKGFMHAAVAENVIAGPAMLRRASYMYGALIPPDEQGHVDCGLGKAVPIFGSAGLIAPTQEIGETGTEITIDGVKFVFQFTPGTEAPAEFNIFVPSMQALCMAENCSANLHNLLTPRGAIVRDSLGWARYIDEAIELYADQTEVMFLTHHWPRWGKEAIKTFLAAQRDTYKYIHDESVRLANLGFTPLEIAETIKMPPKIESAYHARGYYGTLKHNSKAVYQYYLGFFDGNPANLDPLPPEPVSKKYVEAFGGTAALMRLATTAFEAGDYRWAAELGNHLVFADPSDREARTLQADIFEQLGYQCESGVWRAFYLTGAHELRVGPTEIKQMATHNRDIMNAMTSAMLFDVLALRLDCYAAATSEVEGARFGLDVGEQSESYDVEISNGVLVYRHGTSFEPRGKITQPNLAILCNLGANAEFPELGLAAPVSEILKKIQRLTVDFPFGFAIVEP